MRSLRAVAAAVATAGLLAAGCGGGEEGGEAPAALEGAEAEQALADAATATNETEEAVEAELAGAVEGLPGGDQEFGIGGTFDPAETTGSFEISAPSGDLELILLSDVAYVTSQDPSFLETLPEGTEWVEIAEDEFESVGLETAFGEEGFTPQLYLALGATDPVAGEATEVGDDAVRSYSFGIDQKQAIEEAPEEAKQFVESAISLEGDNPSIEGTAGIDAEGRMRFLSVVGTVEPPAGGLIDADELRVTLDIEYPAFGVDADFAAPDEEATVALADTPEALPALQSAFGGGS